jgi:phosphate-selective porin OprO/OprP
LVPPPGPPTDESIVGRLERELSDFRKAYDKDKGALPRIKVNAVFQADQGWFNQGDNSKRTFANPLFPGDTTPPQPQGGTIQDGADFRRARLAASGQVTENMNGFFQMDFAFFGRPTFTDVWAEYVNLPLLGAVRVGQWKQPFSLEVVSSFRYTTFAERSLLFQAFVPFRHLGVGFYRPWGDDFNGTVAASLIKTGQDQFGDSLSTVGGNGVVGRSTWLPYYDAPANGRYYLHLGAAYAFFDPSNNLARFRTSPEIYIGEVSAAAVGTSGQNVSGVANGTPFFVDTGNIRTRGYNIFGTELLGVWGPLSLQNEVMAVNVQQIGGAPLNYWGEYTTLAYFLTGEHRPYDRKLGVIDRVIPFEDFFRLRGPNRSMFRGKGAWELAARWSHIDLNSGPIANVGQPNYNPTVGGGKLNDVTFGVNWYLNPYSKVQFNYICAMLTNNTYGYSTTNVFDLRYQMDF